MGWCCCLKSGKAGQPAPAPSKEEPANIAQVTPEEKALTQLKIIFDSIDLDGDHSVDKAELANALNKDSNLGALIKEAGFNDSYNTLEEMDSDKDGRLTWSEFEGHLKKTAEKEVKETGNVAAAELPASEKAWAQLKLIFNGLDTNSDGAVSKDELMTGLKQEPDLGKLITEAGLNTEYFVLEQIDTNHDGRICWDEFAAHLKNAAMEEVKALGDVVAALPYEEETNTEGMVEPKGCCGCS